MKVLAFLPAVLFLSACQGGSHDSSSGVPGDSSDTQPYAGIGDAEVVRFTGNEPFWGGQVEGDTLTYKTPENIEGTAIVVERFAGRGGISYAGELDGAEFRMAITPGDCSDSMSDRTYPFVVTLQIGAETRNGCAWSDAQPFDGPENP